MDAEELENTFVWAVRVGVLRLVVGRKCCCSTGGGGRAGRGIVGGGVDGAWRAEIYRRRVGRRLCN